MARERRWMLTSPRKFFTFPLHLLLLPPPLLAPHARTSLIGVILLFYFCSRTLRKSIYRYGEHNPFLSTRTRRICDSDECRRKVVRCINNFLQPSWSLIKFERWFQKAKGSESYDVKVFVEVCWYVLFWYIKQWRCRILYTYFSVYSYNITVIHIIFMLRILFI